MTTTLKNRSGWADTNPKRPNRRRALVAVTLVGSLAITGCSSDKKATPAAASTTQAKIGGTITVFAAASLTQSFTALGKKFEALHPGTTVKFSFGGSSSLATNIDGGAPGDVFASASTTSMDQVIAKGYATAPKNFVKNVLEIATPSSNPRNIATVADLAKPGVKVDLCDVKQPCGATAAKLFANAKVTVTPVSYEPDVKSVLAKVTAGEVDAGVVYVTDVKAAGAKVHGVTIPADVNASTLYPIAALKNAANANGAAAFVAYILSVAGTTQLTADGFAKP